ncbi:hypothetical protein CIPAW_13G117300 [Carya illinoinensis]|uniref:Protein FAR1-RELATED SEQUENCE n=1 Tax=Carya illinoinensis TaxID=32201 RepID=A0A8T1NQM3_CARIL|nr:hypothetical protein CIPAW_13G117300 [Carya illinoinensis]
MENEKNQPTPQTLSTSNPPSENAGYSFQQIMEQPTPFSNTSSATSKIVGSELDNKTDGGESEAPCASPIVDECTEDRPNLTECNNASGETSQNVEVVDDEAIEEPKSGMEFKSLEELLSYYKEYGKKCGFGVMTKRTDRDEDDSVRYVTLCCARGGKARNRTLNVANPRPTGKTECGAGALRQYFLRMQYKNPGFFYMMDIDDDGRLKNVFWADPRSRAAYQYFGDVVTFDTTYLTNRYGMPFAPLVGVNHHGQSILLGAGLISSEDTETFVWLFETWLQCMDGNALKSIITDQDRAMKNVIGIVFPNTRHRFCLWHILKKVPEKLGSYGSYKTGMKNALMKCVYDSQHVDEFEKCWDELLTTYNLQENAWLHSLYVEREHWVPAFFKDCFWAGMSTTQRSESMNAFFDGYVHSRTNLKEFVDQFDNALKKKIENENLADFHSFNVTIPCISRSPIEKRFQELYTIAKFKEVQQQVNGIIDLNPKLHTEDGAVKTYMVDDEVCLEEFTKLVRYFVQFSEIDAVAKCSCGLFEMRGILCRHILAIFRCNDIKYLPEVYILDRWRKDIKRRYTLIKSSYDEGEQRPDSNRYSSLLSICYQMITHAAGSIKHTEDARTKLEAMIELYRANEEPPSMTRIDSNVDSTANATTVGGTGEVHNPRVVKGKDRPPSLKRASRMEIDIWKAKAKTKKAQAKGKRKEIGANLSVFEQFIL